MLLFAASSASAYSIYSVQSRGWCSLKSHCSFSRRVTFTPHIWKLIFQKQTKQPKKQETKLNTPPLTTKASCVYRLYHHRTIPTLFRGSALTDYTVPNLKNDYYCGYHAKILPNIRSERNVRTPHTL